MEKTKTDNWNIKDITLPHNWESLTFERACIIYLENYSKLEKKTWEHDVTLIRRFLLPWFPRLITEIKRIDVCNLKLQICRNHGSNIANHTLACISSIFNKLISWGCEVYNPAKGIGKYSVTKRDRFVTLEEYPKLINALDHAATKDMKDFFLLCLFTGARRSNVLSMRWYDIDFAINEWRIPDTKNGQPVRIPLIDQALEVINRRKYARENDAIWVFPSGTSRTGHIREPKRQWNNVLEYAGIEDLRIHDLRRTFGSYQAIAGSSLPIIGQSLGHKSTSSTNIYARLSNKAVRQSIERAFQQVNDPIRDT